MLFRGSGKDDNATKDNATAAATPTRNEITAFSKRRGGGGGQTGFHTF